MKTATRILVVDDEPTVRQLFVDNLRRQGYEVRELASGGQVVQLTRQERPDLVLLDVMLPEVNGLDICRQIKADPSLEDVCVVLVSGKATGTGDKIDGLETGADDYILKPVELAEFLARVRTILRLHHAQKALRASEQHYRRLVEILPDAVGVIDPKGKVLAANPQAAGMLGYATAGELVGKSAFDLVAPASAERLKTNLAGVLSAGISRDVEYSLLTRDGRSLSVEISAAALTEAGGDLVGLVAIGRDVTERQRAEQSLRRSEELSRKIISTAVDGFWRVDLEGKLLDVNEAYCRMIGYGREELLSMRISDLEVNEPTPAEVEQHIQRMVRSGGDHFETRHRRKDGRLMDLEVSTTFLDLDGRFVVAFLHDVTKAKQAAQRLAEAMELNQTMMAASPLGIMAYRATGQCVFANEASAAMLNGTVEQLLQQNFRQMVSWKESGLLEVAEAALRGQRGQDFQVHHMSSFGRAAWLECHMDSFASGGEPHLLVVSNEITERKRMEEELHQLPRRIIEAQEAERQRVARELHDGVNQIIAAARMRVRKVALESARLLKPAAREILARSDKLLGQALEENRKIARNLRPTDLDELGLAAACRNLCRQLESRTNLQVRCRFTGLAQRLPPGLELNVFRIVQEALTNVEKHARARSVRLRLAREDGFLKLAIKDDGRGFAPAASRPATRKGRGIGLTNMRERAASLDGTWEVKSAPRQGTVITVRVPLADPATPRS